ncbi:MAG: hypothetical protein QF752_03345 [Planctomycetota bacterium]|nr:hypothetical protein [Planctomycetota bacterium]
MARKPLAISLFLVATLLIPVGVAQQAKGSGLIRGDQVFEKGNMSVRKPPAKKFPQWKMVESPFPSTPEVFLQIANKSRDASFLFRRILLPQGASKSADDVMKDNLPQIMQSVKNYQLIKDGKEAFGAKGKRTRMVRFTGVPYVMMKTDTGPVKQEDPQQRVFLFEYWVTKTKDSIQVVIVQIPKVFLNPKIDSNKKTMAIMKYIKSQIRFF